MFETKSALTSRAVWGGVLAMAAPLAGWLGYTVSSADQAEIAALVSAAISVIGGALAIWGRIKATKRIG